MKKKNLLKLFFSLSGGFAVAAPLISPVSSAVNKPDFQVTLKSSSTNYAEVDVRDSVELGVKTQDYIGINERMNSTVVNEDTATSIDTLDTTATLIKNGNIVSDQVLTYFDPWTICDYVQLNTYNLPRKAQITYVVGYARDDYSAHQTLLGTDYGSRNSLVTKYTSYAEKNNTILYVNAYSNMIYKDGVLDTSENHFLSSVKFSEPSNRPRPLDITVDAYNKNPNQYVSWTFGLRTNRVDVGSVSYRTVRDENKTNYNKDGAYNNWALSNSYIIPLIVYPATSGHSGIPAFYVEDFYKQGALDPSSNPHSAISKDGYTIDLENQVKGIPAQFRKGIVIPGLNYLYPTLDVVPSLWYEICKEMWFPSEYNNVKVGNLVSFSSQGFDRGEIYFNKKYYNDLLGKMTIEIVGVPAPLGVANGNSGNSEVQTTEPYVYTIYLDGFKCWLPIVIAVCCATAAIILMVIAIIILNKTTENKKYKLVRRTL